MDSRSFEVYCIYRAFGPEFSMLLRGRDKVALGQLMRQAFPNTAASSLTIYFVFHIEGKFSERPVKQQVLRRAYSERRREATVSMGIPLALARSTDKEFRNGLCDLIAEGCLSLCDFLQSKTLDLPYDYIKVTLQAVLEDYKGLPYPLPPSGDEGANYKILGSTGHA